MSTQIAHLMHTDKKGYFWRKRYDKNTIEIVLHTKAVEEAQPRAAALTIRFMELETLGVPFKAMRDTLKGYRDNIMKQEKVRFLQAMVHKALPDASQGSIAGEAVQSLTQHEKVAQIVVQRELDESAGHSLEELKAAYFDANTGNFSGAWSAKTVKDYNACIDRFIVWCTASSIPTVEAVSKDNILSFKQYMDELELAPNTKQKILTRAGSMFKFAVEIKEWLVRNPVQGMMYKKVEVVKKKEEIRPEQFRAAMAHPLNWNDGPVKWANAILYHTGMRVSEMCQLTKNDYVEIEGIKCFSVNTHEEGKSTKTATSIRNIPIADELLEWGIWEAKPVFKMHMNTVMTKIEKSFKLIGLKRTSHCFRHSISNRLRDVEGVEDSTRNFILGQANGTITDRVYVSREPLLKMQRAINAANV